MAGLRRLIVASVAAAGLAGAHSTPSTGLRRKTMGFGPDRRHATFATGDVQPIFRFVLFASRDDPIQVAKLFATAMAHGLDNNEFYVRDDSYTDSRTGVSHVYLRQTVFGIDVADGDMNVNIKDGRVLSYGDTVSDDASRVNFFSD